MPRRKRSIQPLRPIFEGLVYVRLRYRAPPSCQVCLILRVLVERQVEKSSFTLKMRRSIEDAASALLDRIVNAAALGVIVEIRRTGPSWEGRRWCYPSSSEHALYSRVHGTGSGIGLPPLGHYGT